MARLLTVLDPESSGAADSLCYRVGNAAHMRVVSAFAGAVFGWPRKGGLTLCVGSSLGHYR